jgi:hypothetical protein
MRMERISPPFYESFSCTTLRRRCHCRLPRWSFLSASFSRLLRGVSAWEIGPPAISVALNDGAIAFAGGVIYGGGWHCRHAHRWRWRRPLRCIAENFTCSPPQNPTIGISSRRARTPQSRTLFARTPCYSHVCCRPYAFSAPGPQSFRHALSQESSCSLRT